MSPIVLNATSSDDSSELSSAISLHGHAVIEGLLPGELLHSLREDCLGLEASGQLQSAAVGRADGRRSDAALRGDATLWFDDDPRFPQRVALLRRLDALRSGLNRSLLLGMQQIEAHYAAFPVGACYVRHRDRFFDDDARVLSFTCYLNPDWRAEDGGALRLHLPDGPFDVLPRLGTCALFLSDEVEHEVLPARHKRYSIAGWFRRDAQVRRTLDQPRNPQTS